MTTEESAEPAGESAADPEPTGQEFDSEQSASTEQEDDQYRDAVRDPIDNPWGIGVGRAALRLRHSAAVASGGNVLTFDSNIVNKITFAGGLGAPLVAGEIPQEQLGRRCRLYDPVDDFQALAGRLASTRALALCGEPNSGRSSTAIVLLHRALATETTEPRIIRLQSDTDLTQLNRDTLEKSTGYVLEPASGGTCDVLTELHLDRLSAMLAECGSYAVVLLDASSDHLPILRSRYGMRYTPPKPTGVLRRYIAELLPDTSEQLRETVAGWVADDDVAGALGLGDLRPAEAERLAELLVSHHHDPRRFDRPTLLASCHEFAAAQVIEWFRPVDGRSDWLTSVAAVRTAAFRIALAVYDGSTYAVVAEAAEVLARRLAELLNPDEAVVLPLFADDPVSRMISARAVREEGVEDLGRSSIPVERIRYAGPLLASAVLAHVWTAHHGIRATLVGWLQERSRSNRQQVWIPVAQACGALAQHDFSYALDELIGPLAAGGDQQARLVAATTLHTAAANERLTAGVNDLVRRWSRAGTRGLVWTAAATYALGRVGGSVDVALKEITRIGSTDDARMCVFCGWCAVQLLGGGQPGAVLNQISRWLADERPERHRLGLLTVVRLAAMRTDEVVAADEWTADRDATGSPLRGFDGTYPLTLALAEANEEWAEMIAKLMWRALGSSRSGPVVENAIKGWVREAADGAALLSALTRFLPRLVRSSGDRDLLWGLLDDMVRDVDEPLDIPAARRLAGALRGTAA